MLKIFFGLIVFSSSIVAQEVLESRINKQLPIIKLGVFTTKSNASNIVKNFHIKYDVYTGLLDEKYYIYLVNIDSHEKYTALEEAKEMNRDAFFLQKSDFKHGVYLLQENQDLKNILKNPPLNAVPPKKDDRNYIDGKLKVDLVDVVFQTLSNSYKAKAARERVIQAKRDIDIAYSDYKPTLDASYTVGQKRREPGVLQEDLNLSEYADFQDQNYALTLKQNVFAGGQTIANVSKIKNDYLVAKNEYKILLENEIMKAINAYYDIVFRREALLASEHNIEKLKGILEITKSKFDSGALSIGELSNVEASISNSMTQLSRIESRYNNALEYYRYIVGKNFSETQPYEKDIGIVLDDFDVVEEKAFQKNSKLKAFEFKIASKKDDLKVKRSAFAPKVDLLFSAEQKEDEEFDRFDGNRYTARVNVNYNIYNGGRDTADYLKAYSSILEDDYERESQAREMVWNLEKLYNSLLSLKENIENIKNELKSSQTMVESYWEGFRYGEQDLYTLLQAQKQLNSAELDLIDSEQNNIIDYFKVLQTSGELLQYFSIDVEKSTFLNMSKTDYNERVRGVKIDSQQEDNPSYIPQVAEELFVDSNKTKDTQDEFTVDAAVDFMPKSTEPLSDMLSFGELFLMEDSKKQTLVFEGFNDIYEALAFINDTDIEKESFIYKKLKNEKVLIDVAYSMFDTLEEASASKELEKFSTFTKEKIDIKTLGEVQEKVLEFNRLHLVDKKSIRPVVIKKEIQKEKFKTSSSFKREFLDAPEDFYTINVATFKTIADAQRVVEAGGYTEKAFVFTYGDRLSLVKFMYGIYESYEDAQKFLDQEKNLKIHTPIIEKVRLKQKLYQRYN